MKNYILVIAATVLCLCGCKGGQSLLPNVSGHAGEVLVVMDKGLWDMEPGALVRDSLEAECPFLPQREKLYDAVQVTPGNFNQMFQLHRNILIFNVNSGVNNPGIECVRNRWAAPQLVIYINAPGPDEACSIFKDNGHQILAAIEQVERQRVIDNAEKYQEKALAGAAKDFTGGDMVFPSGWSLKKKTADFMWLSYETTYVQQGVFIYRYPSTGDKRQWSRNSLVAKRNEVLRENVPGMVEGSYMTTSDVLAPGLKYARWKDRKFAELRGLWDVHGDFMGGPFVSHSFYTPDGHDIICMEAYVYAPKYDKRHYLRQTESLLYSFRWNNEGQETSKQ